MKKMGIITAISTAMVGLTAAMVSLAKKRADDKTDAGTSFNEAPTAS